MIDTRTVQPLGPHDPRRLGPWELRGRLGAGGMGVVYLGHDGSRLAAVKTIAPYLADSEEFRSRFRREVAVASAVAGPFIARLYDAAPDASPPWLAVQYVAGPTLEEAVRDHGPLAGVALEAFALTTLEAVHQLHARGVLHRDLTPANVILTPDGPVLIDFGIARLTDGTAITATRQQVGSPGWIAPEVLLGQSAGTAADVFAWGALVAYAATGQGPFGRGPGEAVTFRVVHAHPELVGLEDPLATVIAECLAKSPGRRPSTSALRRRLSGADDDAGTAEAVTQIVSTWSSATSVLTRVADPVMPGGGAGTLRTAHRRRRRRNLVVAAALVAALGVSVPTATLLLWDPTPAHRTSVSPPASASASASASDGPQQTASPTRAGAESTPEMPTSVVTAAVPVDDTAPGLVTTIETERDMQRMLDFAHDNIQREVVLDLLLSAPIGGSVDVDHRASGIYGLEYLRDHQPYDDCSLCGLTVLIAGMSASGDASVSSVGLEGKLTGRFLLQRVDVGTGGFIALDLRAVGSPDAAAAPTPAPSGGLTPAADLGVQDECAQGTRTIGDWPGFVLTPYAPRAHSAATRTVQDVLNTLGWGCLVEDGIYGPNTASEVRAYQRYRGYAPANGLVDEGTWNLLRDDAWAGDGACPIDGC
ncbi:hypothetical protein E8D34_10640 [Nocardioides sp. GY 10113]|uniref:serine/threonine-protein kinase n=1 Tax=Nocardioides sp. GY 10113 TaxID=2569761 RepID=UPI0010A86043|nr:serine/threonine-protein kinase [Nocardioides sp. GY 10113]TIC86702.1 hypothetical protein E8D34_10640 [Nocardioides sp. GY 10113]